MKVKRKMINKELRGRGTFIRFFYRFRLKGQFRLSNKLLNTFIKGRFPKDLNIKEKYITTSYYTKLRILICYPKNDDINNTGILFLHGGGYALGLPEQELGYVRNILNNTNSVVVLPDYTLSLDKPYPYALYDAYETLLWMENNALSLKINKNQLFVMGESAGGGLTASLSLYARDKGEVNIAFQMPLYPMIDSRMNSMSMKDNNAPVWDYKANKLAWRLYLGPLYNKDIPTYASVSLETDYKNLPPTYTFVGDIEPFYDETITYINKLKEAGVNAKVDVYNGCFHAFDFFGRKTKIGKEATNKWINELKYATLNYFANN